jgi:membrane-associated phospholipid phosphatase
MSTSNAIGTALQAGETLGGARTQLAAALATYTIGRVAGNSKVATIGADLISAQILTQSMTAAIKLSVGRTRPDGTQYSFPSGHSSVTFATATVLQRHLGWKVGIPAYGLATYVAASRVHDRRHFLSDVTFGAALGIIGGRSVTLGSGNARFSMSPAPAPGGAAVAFTWTPESAK